MDTSPPRPEILQAFNLSGKPIRISGGQGTCYQVGSAVLKPIENEEESNWIADLNAKLVNDAFSVPKYIRAEDGSWVVNGWVAYEFVEGKHKAGNYAEAIIISQEFHKALVGIPKPTFFEKRNNVWSVADRIAWG
ncbi:aminoglycoside phosphotransferase, partial [Patescibacteria group bacterium]|nr:aminoglycoside phosphotransferase [Patescibacteria group bacterium]MBU1890007.1 aminoglycoside phosphotransferase [Patescibacteria group bacterium]